MRPINRALQRGAEVVSRISNFTDKGPDPYSQNSNGMGCTIVGGWHKIAPLDHCLPSSLDAVNDHGGAKFVRYRNRTIGRR